MNEKIMCIHLDSFDAETCHLELGSQAAYIRLLMLAYRQPDMDLPDDPNWISYKARLSREDVVCLLEEFFTLKNERWVRASASTFRTR